jgi:hypothetical protein
MATERRRSRDRKSISTVRPRNYSDLYKNSSAMQVAPAPTSAAPGVALTSEIVDWKHDYAYVANDLRRLLIVSAVLFTAIILAGIFI